MSFPLRALLLGLVTFFCFASSALAVDLKDVHSELEQGKAILIDVREEREWNEAHLEKAILVPGSEINSGEQNDKVLKLIKAKPEQKIYCHCKSGGRAKLCARVLGKLGVEVIPITDSYKKMVQAGFEEADTK
ncbi:rhodanese-like domain-containing protein [Blastopirellula marina]|uniref:Rhodanese domain-containing protein n=1 Tax=Blastopirellula marina TaxID=124 RepID=A0A2S8GJ20_9BACT|nr:rhodanese-like domain-containing protein [Blastopirellula marina]PQO44443.1 hypothetical protein C5Y93_18690 [Blastopirellula marina]